MQWPEIATFLSASYLYVPSFDAFTMFIWLNLKQVFIPREITPLKWPGNLVLVLLPRAGIKKIYINGSNVDATATGLWLYRHMVNASMADFQ